MSSTQSTPTSDEEIDFNQLSEEEKYKRTHIIVWKMFQHARELLEEISRKYVRAIEHYIITKLVKKLKEKIEEE